MISPYVSEDDTIALRSFLEEAAADHGLEVQDVSSDFSEEGYLRLTFPVKDGWLTEERTYVVKIYEER